MTTPNAIDFLCGFISTDTFITKTEKVEQVKSTYEKSHTTPRKVYRRNNITHICLNGQHWTGLDTKIDHKLMMDEVHELNELTSHALCLGSTHSGAIMVRQGEVSEIWFPVQVPRKHRTGTNTNSFQMAANAQLTGWTY